jgi:hypothetical protein
MKKSFNIQELLSWNQAHALLLVESFPSHQEHNLKHLASMDLITTKQNKINYLPSLIDLFNEFT